MTRLTNVRALSDEELMMVAGGDGDGGGDGGGCGGDGGCGDGAGDGAGAGAAGDSGTSADSNNDAGTGCENNGAPCCDAASTAGCTS